MEEYKEQLIEESKNLPVGLELPFERKSDLFFQYVKKYRDFTQRPVSTKNPDGSYDDYLEQRRPFIAPNPHDSGSH